MSMQPLYSRGDTSTGITLLKQCEDRCREVSKRQEVGLNKVYVPCSHGNI